MSQRKLALLEYPADTVDYENHEHLQELVQFLEDQHIRFYKIEDREGLRSRDSSIWNNAFNKYLDDLKCPFSFDKDALEEIIDWLLTYAINILYQQSDSAKDLTASRYEVLKAEKEKKQQASDPLSTIDFTTKEARECIEQLRATLGIASHPDSSVVLKACCKFIAENLSNESIQEANKEAGKEKKTVKLSHLDLGMKSSKNGTIDAALRALRLIHLENLRELQTEINEAIVAVQELTADPKTDKRLGKVGF